MLTDFMGKLMEHNSNASGEPSAKTNRERSSNRKPVSKVMKTATHYNHQREGAVLCEGRHY